MIGVAPYVRNDGPVRSVADAAFLGPEFVGIYNDALVPIMTDKHPAALGRPAREVWAEAWEIVGPQMQAVRDTGEAIYYPTLLVPIHRDGAVQDV